MTDSFDKKSHNNASLTVNDHFNAEIDTAPLTEITEEEDAIDRLLVDTGFDRNYEKDFFPSLSEISVPIEEFAPPSVLNESKPSAKNTNFQRENIHPTDFLKSNQDREFRCQKATLLSYAAMSTATVALIAAIALTIYVFRLQSNVSSLSAIVASLKEVWFVNLISYKDLPDARKKSAEFLKKGVQTEIVKVRVNHEIWYRLRVGGFTSRKQAVAYANKIKKNLQLNTLWIANS